MGSSRGHTFYISRGRKLFPADKVNCDTTMIRHIGGLLLATSFSHQTVAQNGGRAQSAILTTEGAEPTKKREKPQVNRVSSRGDTWFNYLWNKIHFLFHKKQQFSHFSSIITCFLMHLQSSTWYHQKEKSVVNVLLINVYPLDHFMTSRPHIYQFL